MPWYAWRCEGVEGLVKADSKIQAAARAAKRLGFARMVDRPKVEELTNRLCRVVSGDGSRGVVVEVFYVGNSRPKDYRVLRPGQKEPYILPDEAALSVIGRYLAHGGAQEGADALWRLHERYRALYRRR